ncbi:MAG TPA: hypothetical protein VFV29_08295, partial [Actinomycetota bacterium]|nr:hypothetical protein [Actinomycetota bacterium]
MSRKTPVVVTAGDIETGDGTGAERSRTTRVAAARSPSRWLLAVRRMDRDPIAYAVGRMSTSRRR